MFTQIRTILMFLAFVCTLPLAGCAPKVRLALNFAPGQTATYQAAAEMTKEVKFDQPSLNKSKFDQTSALISVTERQEVLEVGDSGSALAEVTIEALKVKMVNKNETRYDFDSTIQGASDPLRQLIGQSYRIRLHSDGTVEVVDAAAARAVVVESTAGRLAEKILGDAGINERHRILSLPASAKSLVSVGRSWSRLEPSPPGLLASKSFEKVYTLDEVKNAEGRKSAVIRMAAAESVKPAPGTEVASAMGPLARMFDTEDNYTGSTTLDLADGQVVNFEEKLVTTYIAEDPQQTTDSVQKPDTLRMRFSHTIEITRLK